MWATMRAMPMAMRVVSNKEGEGGKAMVMVTRVVGERRQRQQ